ncbi:hypothetical protein G6F57_008480 [Rhizopus arrhizus]|nr:hypothetical protein G6F23_007249 [Rhizopus arrhizus]KAG1426602.1 hypothetical protein G6F58_001396 [Rhizopus delemar]KAG0775724.1 hypothetical protein G6F22_013090 [Rhizopus arrhizus]KAG0786649.1 hypothetical protein G6F21_008449 [Rhizopus arrhizus]KAG0805887.1 hypothetical protein G6F20_011555 [Rhizopus arrhizus]
MEKLFAQSGLRLKWEDTKLSLNDIGPKNNLKVDLRILNDETIQFVNHETDSGVLEAARSDLGPSKYQSDHCKLMVECKSIIEIYINKGHNLDTVDCIQICGLEILILNLSLSATGVYVANEIYHGSILDSLSQMDKMLDIALNLLSFKTTVIEIKNKYVQQKSTVENSKRSVKSKKYDKALKKKSLKADKKAWTRGTWVAFRDGKTEIPPPPSNLTA